MWPNFFTGFPFPFPSIGRANFNTLPTVAVTVGTENVTLELPNHAFQNSWDHEKGHLCRHISKAFGIDPYGEEAQYLSGYVGQKMFPVAKKFLCEHCRKGLEK